MRRKEIKKERWLKEDIKMLALTRIHDPPAGDKGKSDGHCHKQLLHVAFTNVSKPGVHELLNLSFAWNVNTKMAASPKPLIFET